MPIFPPDVFFNSLFLWTLAVACLSSINKTSSLWFCFRFIFRQKMYGRLDWIFRVQVNCIWKNESSLKERQMVGFSNFSIPNHDFFVIGKLLINLQTHFGYNTLLDINWFPMKIILDHIFSLLFLTLINNCFGQGHDCQNRTYY